MWTAASAHWVGFIAVICFIASMYTLCYVAVYEAVMLQWHTLLCHFCFLWKQGSHRHQTSLHCCLLVNSMKQHIWSFPINLIMLSTKPNYITHCIVVTATGNAQKVHEDWTCCFFYICEWTDSWTCCTAGCEIIIQESLLLLTDPCDTGSAHAKYSLSHHKVT